MEKIDIICVGTLKEKYMRELCAEYVKRMSRFCSLTVTELSESRLPQSPSAGDISRALDKECAAMLACAPHDAYKIAMCVEGAQFSSEKLAYTLDRCMTDCGKAVIFIGSSYGLSDTLKNACDLRLSMSCMTFPHQLARCMLLEQLYRSYKIRRNETYHK